MAPCPVELSAGQGGELAIYTLRPRLVRGIAPEENQQPGTFYFSPVLGCMEPGDLRLHLPSINTA